MTVHVHELVTAADDRQGSIRDCLFGKGCPTQVIKLGKGDKLCQKKN